MSSAKWLKTLLSGTLLSVFLYGALIFTIDPFQQYRPAKFYKPIFDRERELNPGLAKTYDYNEVITGSSMTENFILSDARKYLNFSEPIKFCMSGATAREIKIMMDTAYRHQHINAVVYGLDLFSFTGPAENYFNGPVSFPAYLYDDNVLNDYRYLLSFDALTFFLDSRIARILSKDQEKFDINLMYQWQHEADETDFNAAARLEEWENRSGFSKTYQSKEFALDMLEENVRVNLVPLVKAHPETTFYIFYPPYSVLAFTDMHNQNWLSTLEKFKLYVYESLKPYKNVKIYDFQSSDVTHNLDNYKDFLHYHQRINTWIFQKIGQNEYRIESEEKVRQFNSELRNNLFGSR